MSNEPKSLHTLLIEAEDAFVDADEDEDVDVSELRARLAPILKAWCGADISDEDIVNVIQYRLGGGYFEIRVMNWTYEGGSWTYKLPMSVVNAEDPIKECHKYKVEAAKKALEDAVAAAATAKTQLDNALKALEEVSRVQQ